MIRWGGEVECGLLEFVVGYLFYDLGEILDVISLF